MSTTYEEQLANARERLAIWMEAETRILEGGQSYSLREGDTSRELTRANLKQISENVRYYEMKINRLERVVAGNTKRVIFARGN